MTAKAMESTGQSDMWHYAVGSDRKGPVPRPTLATPVWDTLLP